MTEAQTEELCRLDRYLADQGARKNDRARLLINACIAGGTNTGPEIIAVLVGLGFNGSHVGITLGKTVQDTPVWPNWGRNADGTYFTVDMAEPMN